MFIFFSPIWQKAKTPQKIYMLAISGAWTWKHQGVAKLKNLAAVTPKTTKIRRQESQLEIQHARTVCIATGCLWCDVFFWGYGFPFSCLRGDDVVFLRSKELKKRVFGQTRAILSKHSTHTHTHSHNDATEYAIIPNMLMRSEQYNLSRIHKISSHH